MFFNVRVACSTLYIYFSVFICIALLMEIMVDNFSSNRFALCKVLWLRWQKALSVLKHTLLLILPGMMESE